jgi:DNA-binding XRE family transcriptional regulator
VALRRLRVAQRRKALGHSQDDLAALVGVDRSTVVRWERAETEPQPWLRRKLASHLRVTPEELTELLEAVSEVPGRGDGYMLLSSVPLDFSLVSGHTVQVMEGFGPEELDELRAAVKLFRRWDASGLGGLKRKAVVGQLNAVAESVRDTSDADTLRTLFQVMAELAQLAGWMAYDRSRILDEIRLAKVRLSQREPVESIAVATSALRMADAVRSSVVYDWLIRFHTELTARHATEQPVSDFADHLRDYLRRTAPAREGEVSAVGKR